MGVWIQERLPSIQLECSRDKPALLGEGASLLLGESNLSIEWVEEQSNCVGLACAGADGCIAIEGLQLMDMVVAALPSSHCSSSLV